MQAAWDDDDGAVSASRKAKTMEKTAKIQTHAGTPYSPEGMRPIPTEFHFGFSVTFEPLPEPGQLDKLNKEYVRQTLSNGRTLIFEAKGSTKKEAGDRLKEALADLGYTTAETDP